MDIRSDKRKDWAVVAIFWGIFGMVLLCISIMPGSAPFILMGLILIALGIVGSIR